MSANAPLEKAPAMMERMWADQKRPESNGRQDSDKLWEVSLKFEALLLQQLMSAMRRSVPQSGLLPKGFAESMYDSMFDQIVTEAAAEHAGLGIAEAIYRQLQPQLQEGSRSSDIQRRHSVPMERKDGED